MLWNDDGILDGQEMNAQPVYKRDWNDHKVINKVSNRRGGCQHTTKCILSVVMT